jgi:hypothetical protein
MKREDKGERKRAKSLRQMRKNSWRESKHTARQTELRLPLAVWPHHISPEGQQRLQRGQTELLANKVSASQEGPRSCTESHMGQASLQHTKAVGDHGPTRDKEEKELAFYRTVLAQPSGSPGASSTEMAF